MIAGDRPITVRTDRQNQFQIVTLAGVSCHWFLVSLLAPLGLVAGRATPVRSSVMRERRSVRIAFLVAVESVESREESLFIGEAEAVVDSHFRFDVLHRLAVAAIQEAVSRSGDLARIAR